MAYRNLLAEMKRYDITMKMVVERLGLSLGAVCSKINQRTDFSYGEACELHKMLQEYDPRIEMDELFTERSQVKV